MSGEKPNVIQVTNISPTISDEQIKHFLEYIGRVREVKLFPENEVDSNQTKVAYARFDSPEHVEIALHLTNTVMVDRALILVPYPDEEIPEENKALRVAAPMSTVAGMLPPTLEWPSNVVNMICGSGSSQTIHTIDPKLIELGLPQYPALPAKTDPSKIEEVRRTIYVSNLDPLVNAEQLVQFFSQAGEVMFARMAGDENLPSRNAYVEFTNQRSVPTALAYNGVLMNNRHLKVSHSLSSINTKPQTKGQEQMTREINEAMKKFKDVEHLIHAAAGANTKSISKSSGGGSSRARSNSRTRDRGSRRHKSRERRRSRDRRPSPAPRKSGRRSSRERRRRSRSRGDRSKRSKSREKRRSKSRERKRSRSSGRKRDRSKDRKKRSRSRERPRRSRSRDRRKSNRRSSSKDKDRKVDKSREHRSKSKDIKLDVKVKRDYDAEEKVAENDAEGKKKNGERMDTNGTESEKTNGDRDTGGGGDREDGTAAAGSSGEDSDTEGSPSNSKRSKLTDAMAELERRASGEADMDTTNDSS